MTVSLFDVLSALLDNQILEERPESTSPMRLTTAEEFVELIPPASLNVPGTTLISLPFKSKLTSGALKIDKASATNEITLHNTHTISINTRKDATRRFAKTTKPAAGLVSLGGGFTPASIKLDGRRGTVKLAIKNGHTRRFRPILDVDGDAVFIFAGESATGISEALFVVGGANKPAIFKQVDHATPWLYAIAWLVTEKRPSWLVEENRFIEGEELGGYTLREYIACRRAVERGFYGDIPDKAIGDDLARFENEGAVQKLIDALCKHFPHNSTVRTLATKSATALKPTGSRSDTARKAKSKNSREKISAVTLFTLIELELLSGMKKSTLEKRKGKPTPAFNADFRGPFATDIFVRRGSHR